MIDSKVGSQIGLSVPRLEGRSKVSGRAEYTHTMRIPGMLHTKLVRSTVPHGRIKSIDTSAAKKVPGVVRVVTIDDVLKVLPDPYYGPAFHDQPILAHEKVRFIGEPVTAVLATDPHIAEEAAQLVVVEYEELPAVYDEVEALTSDVYVHDELKPAGSFADLKHLKGAKKHQRRAKLPAASRRIRPSLPGRRIQVRARIQDPESPSSAVRTIRVHLRLP
jgi:CO/xanthine dehydrogenase Mo-binding subunit